MVGRHLGTHRCQLPKLKEGINIDSSHDGNNDERRHDQPPKDTKLHESSLYPDSVVKEQNSGVGQSIHYFSSDHKPRAINSPRRASSWYGYHCNETTCGDRLS